MGEVTRSRVRGGGYFSEARTPTHKLGRRGGLRAGARASCEALRRSCGQMGARISSLNAAVDAVLARLEHGDPLDD